MNRFMKRVLTACAVAYLGAAVATYKGLCVLFDDLESDDE